MWLTVGHYQLTQYILMMKTMFRNKVKTLRLVNEVIKLKDFNDLICLVDLTKQFIYEMTQFEITYVSVKWKSLQREFYVKNLFYIHS